MITLILIALILAALFFAVKILLSVFAILLFPFLVYVLVRKLREKEPVGDEFTTSGDAVKDTKDMMKFLSDRASYVGVRCGESWKDNSNFKKGLMTSFYCLVRVAHEQGLWVKVSKKNF